MDTSRICLNAHWNNSTKSRRTKSIVHQVSFIANQQIREMSIKKKSTVATWEFMLTFGKVDFLVMKVPKRLIYFQLEKIFDGGTVSDFF